MTSTTIDEGLLRRYVRAPGSEDHKYSRGVLGFLTGSQAYPGAALIGVDAALRTGIGMVRYLGDPTVASQILQAHPEVVLQDGSLDAVVIGSGMPTPPDAWSVEHVRELAGRGLPVVLDAGALSLCDAFGPETILTPHHGELDELHQVLGLPAASTDLERGQAVSSRLGMCVVVKGSITHVVSGSGTVWTLPVATPWLATAGTGDALAGIIGALLAGYSGDKDPNVIAEIAVTGAIVHQRAALRASLLVTGDADSAGGPITVGDLCQALPAVISHIISS